MSEEKVETLTQDELNTLNVLRGRVTLAESDAQRALAVAKLADSEVKNFVLQVYNKYDMKIGKDQLLDDGTIKRDVTAAPVDPVATPAVPVEG